MKKIMNFFSTTEKTGFTKTPPIPAPNAFRRLPETFFEEYKR